MWDQKTNKSLAIFLAWAVKKCGNEARDTSWLVRVSNDAKKSFGGLFTNSGKNTDFQPNPQPFVRL